MCSDPKELPPVGPDDGGDDGKPDDDEQRMVPRQRIAWS
jgi:hypothetical protein